MNTDYLKSKSIAFSYLEFGAIDPHLGKKTVYDFRTNAKAYDWLMHARYSNDLFSYHRMSQLLCDNEFNDIADIYTDEIHHNDDFVFNLNKVMALELVGSSFFELGQTLFGCIDGMEFIRQLQLTLELPSIQVDLSHVNWFGYDISPFFNLMAKLMHEKYKVITTDTPSGIPASYDVFFAKGITLLYAIRTGSELFDYIKHSKITVFDYSFSLCAAKDIYIGTGKCIRYLSKDEFTEVYQQILKSGKDIWVRGNSKADLDRGLFYMEGIVACDDLASQFILRQEKWRASFSVNNHDLYSSLIHNKNEEYWRWVRLSSLL
ncbi:hypothetical protein [Aeromonas veronii]|uniref:hypothetical protein n=1 Tax=Aeromonas veronii TaxID=654 RepID=UPI001FD71C38|nr:hypothetical protein [Aeromonas veronii]MCJ8215694.1 hypothetical protein [Aeromonas veronii]USP59830.1 hypothetical protein J6598_07970 [Aeromonas veronii]